MVPGFGWLWFGSSFESSDGADETGVLPMLLAWIGKLLIGLRGLKMRVYFQERERELVFCGRSGS